MSDTRVPDPVAAEMAMRQYGRYRITFPPRNDLWLQQTPSGWMVEDESGHSYGPYRSVVRALESDAVRRSDVVVPGLPDDGISLVSVHDPKDCAGRGCSFHHPSNHHMREWPTLWRNNHGYFERVCPHGIGHPDPDDIAYFRSVGKWSELVHGCDGCCTPPRESTT